MKKKQPSMTLIKMDSTLGQLIIMVIVAQISGRILTNRTDSEIETETQSRGPDQYVRFSSSASGGHKNDTAVDSQDGTFDVESESGRDTENCKLIANKHATAKFRHLVQKRKFSQIKVSLKFKNVTSRKPKTNSKTIMPHVWVWMTKQAGPHMYLNWPLEVGVWSLGLLNQYTIWRELRVTLKGENCSHTVLTVGQYETDALIGQTLANMAGVTGSTDESTYWCHFEKRTMPSQVWGTVCNIFFCPFVPTGFVCCEYKVGVEQNDTMGCDRHVYTYVTIWWVIPFIVGFCLFIYSPYFILVYMQTMYSKYNPKNGRDRGDHCRYIYYKTYRSPITFIPTIVSPCRGYFTRFSPTFLSRIVRFITPFLALSLIIIEVTLDRVFLYPYVQEYVAKSVPIGFRSMAVGFKKSTSAYLSYMGGPYVAVFVFIVAMWIFTMPPRDFSHSLATGIPDLKKLYSPVILPLDLVERLGSKEIVKANGYNKVYHLILASNFMLLNPKFWRLCYFIFKARWFKYWYRHVNQKCVVTRTLLSVLPCLIMTIFCTVETVIAIIYCGAPAVSWGTILTVSFVKRIYKLPVLCPPKLQSFLKLFFSTIFTSLFLLVFFVSSLVFMESFIFLSRIALFTYAGIVRYPKESYGIIIMVVMSTFYVCENIRSFGDKYSTLLKIMIEKLREMRDNSADTHFHSVLKEKRGKFGVSAEFYYFFVEHVNPRRVQILKTVTSTLFTIFMVSISVLLIDYFDTFRSLDTVVHVLTALIISAVPKFLEQLFKSEKRALTYRKNIRRHVERLSAKFVSIVHDVSAEELVEIYTRTSLRTTDLLEVNESHTL